MKRMYTARAYACVLFSLFLALQTSLAWALDPVYSNSSNQAIRGYDPVAYFKQSKAVEGNSQFQYEWKGAKWLFSSQANKDDFVQSPEKYAPQYGGYCAWAVSKGATASTDPHAWRIHEGKLYLNYSKDVQKKWLQDIPGNVQKADANWPSLLTQN